MKNMTWMTIRHDHSLRLLQFPLFNASDGLLHFCTTRIGGTGRGEYDSLNLGEYCGDEDYAVRENRKRLCFALSIPSLFAPNQIHESQVLVIDNDFFALSADEQIGSLSGVDALITGLPDVCISVTTADCVPVLIYAPDKQIVAAVHAGWRGTVLQIVPKVVRRLVEQYGCNPSEMIAGIGPSICQANYEVGEEVVNAFRMIGSDLDMIIKKNPETGKSHLDLWEANRQQLLQSGFMPGNIEIAGLCTYSDSTDFFSARRQGIQCGRMLSGIMIRSHQSSKEPFYI